MVLLFYLCSNPFLALCMIVATQRHKAARRIQNVHPLDLQTEPSQTSVVPWRVHCHHIKSARARERIAYTGRWLVGQRTAILKCILCTSIPYTSTCMYFLASSILSIKSLFYTCISALFFSLVIEKTSKLHLYCNQLWVIKSAKSIEVCTPSRCGSLQKVHLIALVD